MSTVPPPPPAPPNTESPPRTTEKPPGSAWTWTWPSALALAQTIALVLAVAAFVECGVKLVAFASATPPAYVPPEPMPELSDKKEDKDRYNRYLQLEAQRQSERNVELGNWTQTRAQERLAVVSACGLLLGIGVAFVAVMLFLAAARAEPGDAGTWPGAVGRMAKWAPGVLALVCATVITTAAIQESKPAAGGNGFAPVQSFAVPQYVPPYYGPSASAK